MLSSSLCKVCGMLGHITYQGFRQSLSLTVVHFEDIFRIHMNQVMLRVASKLSSLVEDFEKVRLGSVEPIVERSWFRHG